MRRQFLVVACLVTAGCATPTLAPQSPVAPSVPAVTPQRTTDTPQAVVPDAVRVDLFSGQLDRAIRRAFRQAGPVTLQAVAGDLVVVPISTRAPGTYVFPDPAATQVTVPADATLATFTLNIALADKLAVGKRIDWGFWFSADNGVTWQFAAQGGWGSYGPSGYHDSFNNVDNPDPKLFVPVALHRGQLIRGQLVLTSTMDLGVTISVT